MHDNAMSDGGSGTDGVADGGTSSAPATGSVLGGSVLVLDMGPSFNCHPPAPQAPPPGNDSATPSPVQDTPPMTVVTQFSAHPTNISALCFSPCGLLLASADVNGQVILVHAVVPSGLLGPAHRIIKPSSTNTAQSPPPSSGQAPILLYKLVRGLSLARIVDIGFDDRQGLLFASSLHGTVHLFDLWQAAAADSSSSNGGDNGGRSLASSWSQHSSKPNSYTDGSPALDMVLGGSGGGAASNSWHGVSGSNELAQYPVTNVSLFLQMTRPNMRALHGYSEQRLKLPMREVSLSVPVLGGGASTTSSNGVADGQSSGGEGVGVDVSDGSVSGGVGASGQSSLFSEVNILSRTVLLSSSEGLDLSGSGHGAGGASPDPGGGGCGSYEVLVGTSEGLLCRYRVITKSASSGGATPPSVKELNRWDMCTALSSGGATGSTNGTGSTDDETPTGSASRAKAANAPPTSSSSLSMYLSLAGHSAVYAVDPPPLWTRPQIVFRQVDVHAGASASAPPACQLGEEAAEDCDDEGGEEEDNSQQQIDNTDSAAVSTATATMPTEKKRKKKSAQQLNVTAGKGSNKSGAARGDRIKGGGTASKTNGTTDARCGKQKGVVKSVPFAAASDAVRTYFPERIYTAPITNSISSYVYSKDRKNYVSAHSRSASPSIPIYPPDAMTTPSVLRSNLDPRVVSAVTSSLLHPSARASGGGDPSGSMAMGSSGGARGIAITRRARTPENLSTWEIDEDWNGDELDARVIAVGYDDEMYLQDAHDDAFAPQEDDK